MNAPSRQVIEQTFQQADQLARQGQVGQAVPLLQAVVKANPQHRKALFSLGQIYLIMYQQHHDVNMLRQAIQCLEHSDSKATPNKNQTFNPMLGKAYLLSEQNDKAERCFHKALREHKASDDVLVHLAMAQSKQIKYAEAEQNFLKTIALNPKNPLAYDGLTQIYEITNQPEKARDLLESVQGLLPDSSELFLVKAKLALRDKQYKEALVLFEKVMAESPSPTKRIEAQYKKAFTLEKQKHYNEAFRQFSAANLQKLAYDETHHHIKERTAYYLGVLDELQQVNLNTLPVHASPSPKQVAFLVGFPRSGTTLVEQALSVHPAITVSDEKEYLADLIRVLSEKTGREHRYPDLIYDITPELQQALQQHYWKAVERDFGKTKVFLDKLPLNLIHLPLIQCLFPDAAIIMALRDPRDVCLSCFFQPFNANAAMGSYYTLKDTVVFYDKVMSLYQRYSAEMSQSIRAYKYEETVADFERQMRDMVAFLGLEWKPELLEFHHEKHHRIITTPSAEAVGKPIYQSATQKWKHYAEVAGDILAPLDVWVERFGYMR